MGRADVTTDDGRFVVEGFLVGGDAWTIQLVMPPYLLELARADVLGIEELPPQPLQNTALCAAVRLELRRGAGLRGMAAARELEARMWASRRPFAMATRPPAPALVGEAAYAEKEQRYFAALGMED